MTRRTDTKQLERLQEEIRSRFSGKKQIFPLFRFPEEQVVEWEGDDIDHFLDICEQSSGSLVYISEWRVQQVNVDDDEVFSGRIGELLQLEVAFLQDGYFHRYKEPTDWWKEYCKTLTTAESEQSYAAEVKRDFSELRSNLDHTLEDMLKEIPAKKWTWGAVRDYCLDHEIPISEAHMLYNRIKRGLLKESGNKDRDS